MKWQRLSAAVVLLLPAWAGAASWSAVISDASLHSEVDVASFVRQGKAVTVWEREVHAGQVQAQPGDFYFKSAKTLMRYDCDRRTMEQLMKVYYDDDGNEIKTVNANYYGRPDYIVPDTDGERMFEYVCNYKKPPLKKTVVAAKKAVKPKPVEKTAGQLAGKEKDPVPAKADARGKPASAPKFSAPSLPILKPSGVMVKPVSAEAPKAEK
ncbi:MAG: hypothetical protein PHX38_08175 [Sulfuricella sp.]|nr:hypothetical protein [Sulfuricella sp.]